MFRLTNAMGAFTAINPFKFSSPSFPVVSFQRAELHFSKRFLVCNARFADSDMDGTISLRQVPPALLAAEKEEAKAVLTLFLKKQGLTKAVAVRTSNKSDRFIDHLVCKLQSLHKTRYLVGRELSTLEIRDALIPYLKSLLEEHGDMLVDVVENFPNPPAKERFGIVVPTADPVLNTMQKRAMARVGEIGPSGGHPPNILYLIELGMELWQIKRIVHRFPAFAYYSLEGKIQPVVEFLVDLGIPKADIPTILFKRPQLCGMSLSENLKPTMTFLENLGVDKKQWAKVICRFPGFLTYSKQKVNVTVEFLREMGLSADNIGKVLTRCPNIISYSVEDNLRPTGEYFHSLGLDVGSLMYKAPQAFGLSIEANLKPVTQFFLERGYSMGELRTMISRYGALYTFSLSTNLTPKWEYFLTMNYSKIDLVKFPHYFGYSLEERIKPRFALVKECGAKLLLNQVLSLSDCEFDKALKRKMKKLFCC